MLINLSNHPSDKWSVEQLKSAIKKYKTVIDLHFPYISPHASKSQIQIKAKTYLNKCLKILSEYKSQNNAVHIMGESTFSFALVNLLKSNNIKCIASTTNRVVVENKSTRTYYFSFVRFREY